MHAAFVTGESAFSLHIHSPCRVGLQYETIVIRCSLRGKVPSEVGGYLASRIDGEHVILYREPRNSHTHRLLSDAHPYTCTFCTYPIFTPGKQQAGCLG